MYHTALFIFRRDLRLIDNTGLIKATAESQAVIPLFIADNQQLGDENGYRSTKCIQFMLESLQDLDSELQKQQSRLVIEQGNPTEIVEKYITVHHVNAVYCNRDYTPFAQQRDHQIAAICQQYGIPFHCSDDALINAPHTVTKRDGSSYTMFTPFYRCAQKIDCLEPNTISCQSWHRSTIPQSQTIEALTSQLPPVTIKPLVEGGRTACTKLLSTLATARYANDRDIPAADGTTHLSAYLKFTLYSPREILYALRNQHHAPEALIRQLYWRDFFTQIAFFFPHVFQGAFHREYDHIPWCTNEAYFKRWCEGTTGFPIVDAGMRQLNKTGWMHNRARLITASFLTKDLHIDWRWGERYFAQQLIDYDPAVNNGNWQWVAGTGCDAQPYFRIFNPWLQQRKFDPTCAYIKTWVPELRNTTIDVIHHWDNPKRRPGNHPYPAPLVEHSSAAQYAINMIRTLRTQKAASKR